MVDCDVTDVLDLELEWFLADVEDLNPLPESAGGPFHVVEREVRRLSQARNQLYLTLGPTTTPRGSKTTRRLDHEVIALVLWTAVGAGQRAHVDQAALGRAVDLITRRVLGPDGDIGHGGRWFRAGGLRTEPVGLDGLLRWGDAIGAAGAAYTVAIRYTVSEFV